MVFYVSENFTWWFAFRERRCWFQTRVGLGEINFLKVDMYPDLDPFRESSSVGKGIKLRIGRFPVRFLLIGLSRVWGPLLEWCAITPPNVIIGLQMEWSAITPRFGGRIFCWFFADLLPTTMGIILLYF